MAKPICGSQGAPVDGSVGGVLDHLIAVGGLVGAITSIIALTEKTALVTLLGVTAPAAIWLAAVAGALAAGFVVFDFYRHRCLTSPDTLAACSAGVVSGTVESFSSVSQDIFPFAGMHDRVDVVVKSIYWPLVETNAGFVHCNNDVDSSPILRGYYKSAEVCAAGLGATIGAGIGVVPGILAGVAIAAAIGCATIILCLLALLVAALIAAIVVIAAAIIGVPSPPASPTPMRTSSRTPVRPAPSHPSVSGSTSFGA
ncbi:MAG TPA: hypothetical protein VKB93_20040 [Thermoanaerobaculia bacterium]|nr:hypothetical protein [Thermoanaerobaculia bacterium]